MSASAGRVLIIPKGTYDASTTYHMLDLVGYNGSSYICKQTTTGNLPTDTTYWQLLANGNVVASIDDIGDVTIASATNGQVLKFNGSDWVNADETGGLKPHLVILSDHGSTVTVVKGITTYTATETSSGVFETDVDEFGTYTIHAILSGDDAQLQLVVDTCKVYTVHDEHFHASITVTYPSGYSCMISGGSETYVATSSPYEFVVHSANTFVITTEDANQNTYTDTVIVTESGQSFSKRCPNGSQLPANDISNWLFSGARSENYTQLSEVLADSTCLAALIASQNAMDYLVRSTDFTGTRPLVPKMTSNTTPSGVASASSELTGQLAYNAFDRDSSTEWHTATSSGLPAWIKYQFANSVNVSTIRMKNRVNSSSSYIHAPKNFTIEGSNDNTTWETIGTFQNTNNTSGYESEYTTNSTDKYTYIRCSITSSVDNSNQCNIGELQFYPTSGICDNSNAMSLIGLNNYASDTLLADATWLNAICNSTYFESVLNVKVPTMTSNTTPSGECFGPGEHATNKAYKAFDGDNSTFTQLATSSTEYNVGYKGATSRTTYFATCLMGSDFTLTLQYSDDNVTWTDASSPITTTSQQVYKMVSTETSAHQYWRIKTISATNKSHAIYTIQFYGRQDV